jgi:phosphoglycolate phosphatase-like HAD superfamily hydrolase
MATDFVAAQTTVVFEVNAEGNADGNLPALVEPAAWTATRQELDQHYFNLSEDARKDKEFWQERQDKINDQNSAIIAANRARDDAEAVVDDAFNAELEQQIASRGPKTRVDAFNEQELAAVQDADEVLDMFSGRDPRDVDYLTILAQYMVNAPNYVDPQ